ncbi:protein FAM181B [Dunckerocampus dactyliophorus]|uniref:protein FAM181B n=1 Tax=Dunckerocampus dactyliophorus TaxID=161453 RepID=UPI0024051638|nr:protein FAM181B [Dunckerocampus dactyliophorus]
MAVQTAIMNPQFMNFCFPGSMMEYDVDKSPDGGLLGEVETEEDYRETTRELLSFMDSASSNIKLALDKPVKSKRKVNHRKYLQKQIKRCTGMISPGNDATGKGQGASCPPAGQPLAAALQSKTLPKRDGVQASLQSRSLAALFSPAKDIRGEKAKKPPLRHRNLPPSFFTEPANCSRMSPVSGMSLRDLERSNPEATDFFELLGPDYGNMAGEQELYPPVRGQTDMGSQDVTAHDTHHFLGGLVYPELWTSCSPPLARKLPESLRASPAAQPALYCHPEAAPVAVEENALCSLAFSNFFTDCSIPHVNYDSYSSL